MGTRGGGESERKYVEEKGEEELRESQSCGGIEGRVEEGRE